MHVYIYICVCVVPPKDLPFNADKHITCILYTNAHTNAEGFLFVFIQL